MSYRSYIRKAISQVFFRYIYETGRYARMNIMICTDPSFLPFFFPLYLPALLFFVQRPSPNFIAARSSILFPSSFLLPLQFSFPSLHSPHLFKPHFPPFSSPPPPLLSLSLSLTDIMVSESS